MLKWTSTEQDASYRKADLTSNAISAEIPVKGVQDIFFPESVVLEIRNKAGQTRLFYQDNNPDKKDPKDVSCVRTGDNFTINLPSKELARVYVTGHSGMEYALPANLPLAMGADRNPKANTSVFFVACQEKLRVVGDKYFCKKYSITMR